jgi:hypothetical protein
MSGHPDRVITLIADGSYWYARGIVIAMVEPTFDGGVRVGVRSDPGSAQAALEARYPFRVQCCAWEDSDSDAASVGEHRASAEAGRPGSRPRPGKLSPVPATDDRREPA